MKSKKIFLCFDDGTLKEKSEKKITYDDIKNCDYFMIPINQSNDCYTLIKPSKYLLYKKGFVEYQLCAIYDEEDTGYSSYEPSITVKTEITSICDLIGLLNSIDKITVANYAITEDYIESGIFMIGVLYMHVILYDKNDKLMYDENFVIKGTITNGYDPYKITKIFNKIYDGTLCGPIASNNQYFIIEEINNKLYWSIDKSYDTTGLIGVPLISSNTLVFCLQKQLEKLIVFNRTEIGGIVYYEKNKFIGEVSENIVNGDDVVEIENKVFDAFDLYVTTKRIFSMAHNRPWTRFLEIVTHSYFCLSLIITIYKNLYENHLLSETDKDGAKLPIDELYDFDVILILKLCDISRNYSYIKSLAINVYSILDLNSILENL